ncbi:MAG: hypothetical protein R3C56_23890 [Pirellulaceae bacterium]
MDDSKRHRPSSSHPKPPRLSPVPSTPASAEEMESSVDEEGVSLEELSQSYRRAVGQATDVVPNAPEAATVGGADGIAGLASELQPFDRIDPEEADQEDIAGCPLTPQSILEAILFVGRSDGSPITAAEIAT